MATGLTTNKVSLKMNIAGEGLNAHKAVTPDPSTDLAAADAVLSGVGGVPFYIDGTWYYALAVQI